MAYIDVKHYYRQIETQYLDMVRYSDEYLKAYKEQRISEEQFQLIQKDIETIKQNYTRLSYIMFLFNLPRGKKNKRKKIQDDSSAFLDLNCDSNYVYHENEYILDNFKKLHDTLKGDK